MSNTLTILDILKKIDSKCKQSVCLYITDFTRLWNLFVYSSKHLLYIAMDKNEHQPHFNDSYKDQY